MNEMEMSNEVPASNLATSRGGFQTMTTVMRLTKGSACRTRVRGTRGASLVEFAIILPVLAVLLFGTMEFGIAFNDYQAIRQGTREGAREAVVKNYGSITSCNLNGPAATAIADVKAMICQTKDRAGVGNDVRVAVKIVDVAPSGYKNNSVKVCAVRLVRSVTGLFRPYTNNKPLKSETEMRAERSMGPVVDLGNTTTWQETDPTGANWSWC